MNYIKNSKHAQQVKLQSATKHFMICLSNMILPVDNEGPGCLFEVQFIMKVLSLGLIC